MYTHSRRVKNKNGPNELSTTATCKIKAGVPRSSAWVELEAQTGSGMLYAQILLLLLPSMALAHAPDQQTHRMTPSTTANDKEAGHDTAASVHTTTQAMIQCNIAASTYTGNDGITAVLYIPKIQQPTRLL